MKWNKFSEKKPNIGQHILAYHSGMKMPFEMMWGGFNRLTEIICGDIDKLTHWMPVPSVGKDDEMIFE